MISTHLQYVKPGFHYPSWRPELTARVDGWPVSITGQHGPCWWVMETGHPSTRAVNSGCGNRALMSMKVVRRTHTGREPVTSTDVYCTCCHRSASTSCNRRETRRPRLVSFPWNTFDYHKSIWDNSQYGCINCIVVCCSVSGYHPGVKLNQLPRYLRSPTSDLRYPHLWHDIPHLLFEINYLIRRILLLGRYSWCFSLNSFLMLCHCFLVPCVHCRLATRADERNSVRCVIVD